MKTAAQIRVLSYLSALVAVLALALLPDTASAFDNTLTWQEKSPNGAQWSPTHFPLVVTQTKFTAENLLYDFGNQQFLAAGARRKGAPLTLRLANVDVPNGVEGVSSELLFTRFFWFARGHSDVRIGQTAKNADVDLSMRILPTTANGERLYSLRIEARAARGKSRGKLLYVKTRPIE
jgi:hypothetical protein